MDPSYSPSYRQPSPPPRQPKGESSPPLVPLPLPDREDRAQSYDYQQHAHTGQGYNNPSPPPSHSHSHSHSHRSQYRDQRDSSALYHQQHHPEDPYGRYPPQHHPQHRDPYADYPQQRAHSAYPPYGHPPPPPPSHYPYPQQRDPYAAYPPRDPYAAAYPPPPPPRDPYGAYPPQQHSYYPPPPPAGPPYPRDPYAAPPPLPVAAPHIPPPIAPPAPAYNPASFGPAPDPNDLSIPLLYLARSVSLKTFSPLRALYANLDLRFINSLLDLEKDLHTVSLEHPNLLGHRRRVWVTAVGGTDSLVQRVRTAMVESGRTLDWREAGDLEELQRELVVEDRRVVVVREEMAEKARREEREQSERRARDAQEVEIARGRREIEEMEGRGNQVQSEPRELDEVLRQMGGGGGPGGEGGREDGEESLRPREREERRASSRHETWGEQIERTRSESPSRARKRSRRESEGTVADEERARLRASRKKLEAVCKSERRRCVDWSIQQGIAVTDETRAIDEEPQLGERHKGVWDLFGQPLEDATPQIQVLMARALRDATYASHLQLYSTPDAIEQLQNAVPWFMTLLAGVKSRYDHAISASNPSESSPSSPLPVPDYAAESDAALEDSTDGSTAVADSQPQSQPNGSVLRRSPPPPPPPATTTTTSMEEDDAYDSPIFTLPASSISTSTSNSTSNGTSTATSATESSFVLPKAVQAALAQPRGDGGKEEVKEDGEEGTPTA